jgi:biopolymer transport protein ExbD
MAMNVGNEGRTDEPSVMIDINTTPLIDVMLVLLIMLIVTIPLQTHAVKLDLPVTNPPPPPTPPPVVAIAVDFDGSVAWNGQPVADRTQLEARLAAAAHAPVQPEIHLSANRLVAYKHVAAVMAAAQRLGIVKIGLVDTAAAE